MEEKRQQDAQQDAAAPKHSFETVAAEFIETQRPGWKNAKHAYQWTATLKTYAYPIIGKMPVDTITTADVVKVLRPIWTTKSETATRLRGRVELVLSYAKAMGWRTGDNPAALELLRHTLAPHKRVKSVKHHAAMSVDDLPAFIAELRQRDSVSARALLFTILTAARTNETTLARHSDIDRAAKIWVVPAGKMKAGREHRVPLSPQAMAIIGTGDSKRLVFPSVHGNPLSNMAMLELLRGMRPGLTVHGFRSTFRVWCSKTGQPEHLAEIALAHVVGSKTQRAYQRNDLVEERRGMMQAWATFCMSAVSRPPAARMPSVEEMFEAMLGRIPRLQPR